MRNVRALLKDDQPPVGDSAKDRLGAGERDLVVATTVDQSRLGDTREVCAAIPILEVTDRSIPCGQRSRRQTCRRYNSIEAATKARSSYLFASLSSKIVSQTAGGRVRIRRRDSSPNWRVLADVEASTSRSMPAVPRQRYSIASQPPHDCPQRWQRSRRRAARTSSSSWQARSSVHSDGLSGLSQRPQPS